MTVSILHNPLGGIRLGDFLQENLSSETWTQFRAAIAFVKQSGVKHIAEQLAAFSNRANVTLSVGIDSGGTSFEGLTALYESIEGRGSVWVYHNSNRSTFHPKIYLFKNDTSAVLVVGSGNLTEGGLFTNYEASLSVSLNLQSESDLQLLNEVERVLDSWSTAEDGLCCLVTRELLVQLTARNYLPTEAESRETEEGRRGAGEPGEAAMFRRHAVPPAPAVVRQQGEEVAEGEEGVEVEIVVPAEPQNGVHREFYMTLQRTDVGVGQTTAGTARRSPEVFIPLISRDFDPEFWGWPDGFVPDAQWTGPVDRDGRGKMDRHNVRMRIGTEVVDVNMWYNPDKKDLRLRSESLRSAGNIGDILRIERADGMGGFSYFVDVIPVGTTRYPQALAACVNAVRRPSLKRWGYL